ncbi:MAG: hypothetical protein WDZ29_00255 [Balneolaceae bacterium]
MRYTPVVLLGLLLLVLPHILSAQDLRQTTLFGWEERTQMMMLDSYHNYGGIFYDQGLLRYTNNDMTKEHDLDLLTYRFTELEDRNWYYNRENSFRTWMGSYDLGMFLHAATIRNVIPITDRLTMPLQITRRFDMRADRALLIPGLEYRLLDEHHIGLRHTITENKPDLDAIFWYRYREFQTGGVQLELIALDWMNNAAYDLGQRRGTRTPQLRRYEHRPWMASIKAASPVWNYLRAELVAGIQTPQISSAKSVEGSDEYFRDRMVARYAGLMAEYARPGFTFALTWQHRRGSFKRSNYDDTYSEPLDIGSVENQHRLGAFLSLSRGRFYTDHHLWYNYNRDAQFDGHEETVQQGVVIYPYDFRERRWMMRNRIGYNPSDKGFHAAIQWSADYRQPRGRFEFEDTGVVHTWFPYQRNYPFLIWMTQERLTLLLGYRFSGKAELTLGASLDVDGDQRGAYRDGKRKFSPSLFDGGFAKLVVYW